MLGQLYWRLVMPFSTWPFPLVAFADATAPRAEQEAVLRSLFNSCECCLDLSGTGTCVSAFPRLCFSC